MEVNHIMARGHDGKRSQICFCVVMSMLRLNEPLVSKTDSRIIARVTSYEIV